MSSKKKKRKDIKEYQVIPINSSFISFSFQFGYFHMKKDIYSLRYILCQILDIKSTYIYEKDFFPRLKNIDIKKKVSYYPDDFDLNNLNNLEVFKKCMFSKTILFTEISETLLKVGPEPERSIIYETSIKKVSKDKAIIDSVVEKAITLMDIDYNFLINMDIKSTRHTTIRKAELRFFSSLRAITF